MNSTELKAAFRADVQDEASDYLWSDAEIFRYMNGAQAEFVRAIGGIPDSSTTAVTQLTLPAGQEFVATHAKILRIRGLRDAAGRRVDILNYEQFEADGNTSWCDYGFRSNVMDLTQGVVRAVVTGMQQHYVRPVMIPAVETVLKLTVDRLPLNELTTTGQTLEIDVLHHEYLLLGMKARALMKNDAETFDRARANENAAAFAAYCAKCFDERIRSEHRYRGVQYAD